jgi:hypothetical protein
VSSSIQQPTTLQQTLQQISETREYRQVLNEVRSDARIISISGLVAGATRARRSP